MAYEEIVARQFFGNTLGAYLTAVGIVLASVIVGKIAYLIINRYLKMLTAKTETDLDDMLLDASEEPAVVFIVIMGLRVALNTLSMPANLQTFASGLVTALITMDVVWLVIRLIDILIKKIVIPAAQKTDTSVDDQLIPMLSKGLKLGVAVVGALVVISNFGFDISALIAGLGIGGLAFALASKDTVENMFGAFAILLDKPFTVKDRVAIDGVTGDVMEIGLRSTRILTLDHTELYIPNAKVVTNHIENISRPTRHLAVTEKLGITYETPVGKVREGMDIIRKILSETEGITKEYPPTVAFSEFSDYSLTIFIKYWVDDYGKTMDVRNEVNQKIKERIERADIKFAYPTQKVFLAK